MWKWKRERRLASTPETRVVTGLSLFEWWFRWWRFRKYHIFYNGLSSVLQVISNTETTLMKKRPVVHLLIDLGIISNFLQLASTFAPLTNQFPHPDTYYLVLKAWKCALYFTATFVPTVSKDRFFFFFWSKLFSCPPRTTSWPPLCEPTVNPLWHCLLFCGLEFGIMVVEKEEVGGHAVGATCQSQGSPRPKSTPALSAILLYMGP